MDCNEPVDYYCDVWQAENLQIPENIPCTDNLDQFFIVLELEITYEDNDDDHDQEEEEDRFIRFQGNDTFTFWALCPRIKHKNLPNNRISDMLSKAGVPRHKQGFMVGRISAQADEIANADHNKDMRVLPMLVSISIIACSCYGEKVDDPEDIDDGDPVKLCKGSM